MLKRVSETFQAAYADAKAHPFLLQNDKEVRNPMQQLVDSSEEYLDLTDESQKDLLGLDDFDVGLESFGADMDKAMDELGF